MRGEERGGEGGIAAVTGAGGFVGRALVAQLLDEGWRVRALSRHPERQGARVHPRLEWCRGDLVHGSGDDFPEGADVLFHLAGELEDEGAMRALHVGGTERLLRWAKESGVRRVVHLSSVGVYGPRRRGRINEACAFAPEGEYEETKAEAELLVQGWGEAGHGQALILRPTIIYGPGMRSALVRSMASAVRRGWMVRPLGVNAVMPVVAVEDVADALTRAAGWSHAGTPWRAWNIADDLPLAEWLALLAAAQGVREPVLRAPARFIRLAGRLGDRVPGSPLTLQRALALTREVRYLSTRARRELSWRPLRSHAQRVSDYLRSLAA